MSDPTAAATTCPHCGDGKPVPVRTIATPLPPVSPRLIQRRPTHNGGTDTPTTDDARSVPDQNGSDRA